ncbi:cytochrome P450 [Streptomyces sp. NBC_01244]|uniref:cytochrome P450 n=1 Tax=Streptomyces sp. NBC_01244 TaxID=2903797 RepID=UPI002E124C68|nr:cytochrome P450 [Streptomyces sp. NBC_01244]
MPEHRTTEQDFDFHGPALDTVFDTYRDLREQCPVGRSDRHGGFWFLTRAEDISTVEHDPQTFSVAPSMLLPPFGTDVPLIPVDIDPPDHAGYRKILLPLFTPKAVERLDEDMRRSARHLATEVAAQEVADVSHEFARPMSTMVFSRLAGFPEKDWPLFDRWIDDIVYERSADPQRARAAGREVMDYFDALLGSRGEDPGGDDLIHRLSIAEIDGRKLTHDELLSFCYLLFLAGLDTTAWAIRSSLWFLAQHPKAQARLREHPDEIPAAAEEFLRTLSPVQAMARTCVQDTEVAGQKIKAGDRVVLVFGAGNRDPKAYGNPDDIVLDRRDNRHLAFGVGLHRCAASNLGRRELVVALQEFLAVVPDFSRTDPTDPWHGLGPLTLRIGR